MPERERRRPHREGPGQPDQGDAPPERDPTDELDEDADRHEQNIETEEPDKQ